MASVGRVWAAPDTVPGMVQRGRGAGYRQALEQGAVDAVVDCVVDDPRWDHQVENRAWQYAALVAELGIDLTRLRAAYTTPPDPRGDSDAWMVVGVLESLALRGVTGAVGELRRYLRTGRDFGLAFDAVLPFADHPEAEGLLTEILEVADDEQLGWAVAAVWRCSDFTVAPWPRWRAASPRLDRAVTAELSRRSRLAGPPTPRAVRVRDERAAILRSARRFGMAVPESVFDLDENHWERTLLAVTKPLFEERRTPHRTRVALRRQLRALRTPRARDWGLRHADPSTDVGSTALAAWANNAGPGDAPRLLDFLTAAVDRDDLYTQCTVVDGLARTDHVAAVPVIVGIFDRTVYSYLRTRCVVALSRLAPDFRDEQALECLDDCEPATRAIAIEHVNLAGTRERVQRIATDPAEEPANRQAAAKRLALD